MAIIHASSLPIVQLVGAVLSLSTSNVMCWVASVHVPLLVLSRVL